MTERPTLRPWFLWFVVVALPLVAFLPSLAGGWIYDDHPLIAENAYVHSWGWWTRWLTHDFWNVGEDAIHFGARMMYWRPAVSATYALDWTVSGGAPIWFHVTNLIGHALVAALAFHVLRRWLGGATVPAFVVALVFALHPTKAESVAWISGRTDVICMFALLVATTGFALRLHGARWGSALEAGGTVLAYLSKEQAIVLPAFVVIETWVAAGRPPIDRLFVGRAARAATPQLAIAIIYLAARRVLMPMNGGGASLPPGDHVLSVLETFGYFFTFSFAPHEHSVQQGLIYSVHGEIHHSLVHVIVGGIGLGALLATAFACVRRRPGITLGVGFYLATLLPTSNVLYTGMKMLVSERFLYVPLLGLALALGSAVERLAPPVRRFSTWLLLAAALIAGAAAMRRSADYGDEQQFWARELTLHPTSSEPHSYFAGRAISDKRYELALGEIVELQRASAGRDMPVNEQLKTTVKVVTIVALLVPDLDTTSLRSIDHFLAAMLDTDQPQAVMDARGVHQTISPTGASYKSELPAFVPRLLALRAELATRLGDDAQALTLVTQARQLCATCVIVVTAEAKALARTGRFDEALAALDRIAGQTADEGYDLMRTRILEARSHRDASLTGTGPAAIREQALMYSTLELWGAAYRVLEPHKDAFANVREVALGFAELAFRAGAPDVAKQVLALHVPAAEIQPMLDDWAAKMGWRD